MSDRQKRRARVRALKFKQALANPSEEVRRVWGKIIAKHIESGAKQDAFKWLISGGHIIIIETTYDEGHLYRRFVENHDRTIPWVAPIQWMTKKEIEAQYDENSVINALCNASNTQNNKDEPK